MNTTQQEIQVLDHGFIRLVNYMGDDLQIIRSARVSFDADWRSGEDEGKDERLIAYLMRNKHTSPFESVVFTFEIKCPFFIARQWHRHRTWSYNEVSARYTELPNDYYVPDHYAIGEQSKDNKQARNLNPKDQTDFNIQVRKNFQSSVQSHCDHAYRLYQLNLKEGIPRELARMVLPLNYYTRFFGTVDLHNLLHFIRLRDHEHAQFEIQEYARSLKELIQPIVPITMKYYEETK